MSQERTRKEDRRMKIPALLHLSRLGYEYLPRKTAGRDRETNIFPEVLREAVERINGIRLADGSFQRLLADLRDMLRAEDLGEAFYRTVRNGWNGLKLLDDERPEMNRFQAGAEVPCSEGGSRFRPDVTIYVNGLPLAMMEVKTAESKGGIQAEYDRMCRRFRQGSFRTFLQAAQVWLFSNGRPCDGMALLPQNGAFFTAASPGEFPIHPGPGSETRGLRPAAGIRRETERIILADNGLERIRKDPDYRKLISPDTPAHRMLTGLAAPERFLFLIRYGIRYIREPEEDGGFRTRKRMLSWEQIEALRRIEGKIRRGFRNWTVPCDRAGGRIMMGAAAAELLADRMAGCRLYWVTENGKDSERAERAFQNQGTEPKGIRCGTADELLKRETWTQERPVFFLAAPAAGYRTEKTQASRIRQAVPEAILITMGEAEGHEGRNFTYMLRCADGTLYCGWTNNLEERVRTHNSGRGAKYTRSRLPVLLVWWETFGTREEAMSREWHIKKMTRAEKERLIREKESEA